MGAKANRDASVHQMAHLSPRPRYGSSLENGATHTFTIRVTSRDPDHLTSTHLFTLCLYRLVQVLGLSDAISARSALYSAYGPDSTLPMVVPKAQLPLFFPTTTQHDNEDDSEVDELQSKSPSAQPGTPPSSPPPNRPSRSKKTRRVDKDVGEDGETRTSTPAASRFRRAQQLDVNAEDPLSDSSQDVTIRRRGQQSNRSLRSSTSKKKAKTPPPTTLPSLTPVPQRAAAQRAQPKITITAKAEVASKRRHMDWSQYDYVREATQSSASIERKPKPDRRDRIKMPSPRLSALVFDERLRTLYESRQEAVDVGERVCRDSGGEPLFFMNEAKRIGVVSTTLFGISEEAHKEWST